jgi:fucose permease
MDQSSAAVSRARDGVLVIFAANGVVLSSLLSRLPDVKQALDLSPSQLGGLLLALSAGAVIGLPSAGRIARRFGARRTILAAIAVAVVGLVGAAAAVELRLPLLVGLALFVTGLGNGVWDVAQNLEGSIVEQHLGRSIMPWFHAAFSAGTVSGALLGALLTWQRVPIGTHVPAVAVLVVIAVIWGTRRFLPSSSEHLSADTDAPRTSRGRSAWTEPRTLLIGVLVLAAAFTEGTANDWLAVAFVDGHDLEPALGVLALAVFLASMTAGRILGTGLLDRFGRVPVLRALFVAAIVGCAMVVFGSPALAYVGAAVWGVGASLGFPVGMSAAADDPARAAVRISVVSTIGYTAFLAGPPLLGFLGDHVGVLNALMVVGAVSAAAILVAPAARPLHEVDDTSSAAR